MSTAPAATTSTSAPATGIGFDEMQAFVTGYYALLPGRPQDAWPKLDAGYQQRAGWSGYRDFWASIRSVSVTSVAPDGDQRVVAHLEYVSNDGRVSIVQVTDAGRRAADALQDVRREHLARALADWTADDLRQLDVLLNRFVNDTKETPI